MSANPGLSLCFPAVIISHFWPVLSSQGLICTGVRFSLKSPEVGSTKRHCPSEVYDGSLDLVPVVYNPLQEHTLMAALVKARVAVSSLWWASVTATSSSFTPVFTPGTDWFDTGDGVGVATRGVEEIVEEDGTAGEVWLPPIVKVYLAVWGVGSRGYYR